jgi:tRNA threonylcarbamoyl adenosine modification protein YeaZ
MTTESRGKSAKGVEEAIIIAVETSSRIGSAALARGPVLLHETRFSSPMQHSSELFPVLGDLLKGHGYTPDDIDQVHLATGPGSFTGLRIAVAMAKAMHLAHAVQIVTVDSLDVVAANLSDAGVQTPGVQGENVTIPDRIVPLFDAKRGQFYASAYQRVKPGMRLQGQEGDEAAGSRDEGTMPPPLPRDPGYCIPAPNNDLWQRIAPDSLLTAQEIVERFAASGRIGLLGDGLLYQRDRFDTDRVVILPERYWSPHAANVHRLGWQKARRGRFADPLALTPFYLRGPEVTLRKSP